MGENPMVAGIVAKGVIYNAIRVFGPTCWIRAFSPTPLRVSFIYSEDICQSQYYLVFAGWEEGIRV